MLDPNIKHEHKEFLDSLHEVYTDIGQFLFDIAQGIDYDEDKAKRLFSVYRCIRGIDNHQKKPG